MVLFSTIIEEDYAEIGMVVVGDRKNQWWRKDGDAISGRYKRIFKFL